ncbi:MAG: hypothetical protein IJO85_05355 [Lachnospiraceae bacterium]|nr:hypothetical protein [Lachnospiraceae bacterium]
MKKIFLMSILTFCLLTGCTASTQEEIQTESVYEWESIDVETKDKPLEPITYEKNTYDTLNVATYVTKIADTYFLADCYHNQILFHDKLTSPITEWKVLTKDVNYAHTIAGDGTVLLIDDTDNNRIVVFENTGEGYVQTLAFDGVGMKPHFVQYDEKRQTFYAWSSITGEMYYFKRDTTTNDVYIEKILKIDELFGVYVRSFTIIGDDIYFVSGHNNEKIIRANADTLEILETYPVPPEIAGMVQLVKIQDYFYLTVSTDNQENQDYATIVRTKDLHSLANGEYEDVYEKFGINRGTPYYITEIDGRYYMAHHRTSENIVAFDVWNNEIENVEVLY